MEETQNENNYFQTVQTNGNEENPLFDNQKQQFNLMEYKEEYKSTDSQNNPDYENILCLNQINIEQGDINGRKDSFQSQISPSNIPNQQNILSEQRVQNNVQNTSVFAFNITDKNMKEKDYIVSNVSIQKQSQCALEEKQKSNKDGLNENKQFKLSSDNNKLIEVVSSIQQSSYGYFRTKKQNIKFNLGAFINVVRAIKLFKSHITPRKPLKDSNLFINDISYYEANNILFHRSQFKNTSIISKQIKQSCKSCRHCFQSFKNLLLQLGIYFEKHYPVIDPLNRWKVTFDILRVIVTMFAIFWNTVEVSFDILFDEYYPAIQPYVKPILITFYLISVLMSLNTGYSEKGVIQKNRLKILKKYFRKRFIVEILTIISFTNIHSINKIFANILKFLIVLQVINLLSLINFNNLYFKLQIPVMYLRFSMFLQLTILSNNHRKLYYTIKIIKLFVIVTFIAHFVAIAFYGQILIQNYFGDPNLPNWINTNQNITMEDQWYKKYIFSLYFSVTTMMTVGYGDITPKNIYEMSIVIISMAIACGVFAYTQNLIGIIISDINKLEAQFKKIMTKVNLYLNDRNIDDDLKSQVQKYLEYKYQGDSFLSKEQEQNVQSQLSSYLLERILKQAKLKILNDDQKIFTIFSDEFKEKLCEKLTCVYVNKDEKIFEENQQQQDPKMYFIQRGNIQIYMMNKNIKQDIVLNSLQKGQIFGELSFLLDIPRSASARASEQSLLYSLTKSDFMDVISYFTSEKEKYFYVINKLNFRQSNQVISLNCYYCNNQKHVISQCPKLHYVPEKDFIILRNDFPVAHTQRRLFFRIRKKYKSLVDFKDQMMNLNLNKTNTNEKAKLHNQNLSHEQNNYLSILHKKLTLQTQNEDLQPLSFNKYSTLYSGRLSKQKNISHRIHKTSAPSSSSRSQSSSPDSSSEYSSFSQSQSQFQGEELRKQFSQQSPRMKNQLKKQNSNSPTNIPPINKNLKETFVSIPEEDENQQENQSQVDNLNNLQLNIYPSTQTKELLPSPPKIQCANSVRYQKYKYSILSIDEKQQQQLQQYYQMLQDQQKQKKEKRGSAEKQQYNMTQNDKVNNQRLSNDSTRFDTKEIKLIKSNLSKMQSRENHSKLNEDISNNSKQPSPNKLPINFKTQKTLNNLQQFSELFNPIHQQTLEIQQTGEKKYIRKSVYKSNTEIPYTKMQIQQYQQPQIIILRDKEQSLENNDEDQELELQQSNEEQFDKMKQFNFFYPQFNYKNVIHHYNILKSIQDYKQNYFSTYSFYTRVNKILRIKALQFENRNKTKRLATN